MRIPGWTLPPSQCFCIVDIVTDLPFLYQILRLWLSNRCGIDIPFPHSMPPTVRPWQIIPKDSPIILFFYSQIFSLLFSQTSPLFFQTSLLFLHYSQTHIINFINILMIYNIIIIQKQSLIRNSCIASWQTVVRNLPGKIPACCLPNELARIEKTRSAAADEGWISATLQAALAHFGRLVLGKETI